jgi:hypothetical protein
LFDEESGVGQASKGQEENHPEGGAFTGREVRIAEKREVMKPFTGKDWLHDKQRE